MIRSGLVLIYTLEECHIIQNLVYYIERAYRIKDFGMWGQGRKDRPDEPELSASSIGITIAALRACDGLNLFGSGCSHETTLFVDPDAVFRNVSILHSLLPRESKSKDVDAALIMTKGFPAFVVEDPSLCSLIEENVEADLRGCHGYKRFIGDRGGRSDFSFLSQDPDKQIDSPTLPRHFNAEEDLEWPFIILFQMMTCVFQGRMEDVERYRSGLDPLLFKTDGYPTIPLYHSIRTGTNNTRTTAFQAFLILSELLEKQLIHPHDIDYRREKVQSCSGGSPIIQIALLSESTAFQALLSTYGITSQTPNQIESVYVWPSKKLVDLLYYHGSDEKLGLTGRPKRPLGSLCTSRVWKIDGKSVVCIPLYQDKQDFYISKDETFIAKAIKSHLKFLRTHWRESSRPTFCLFLTSLLFKKNGKPLFKLLNTLKSGKFKDIPIKMGRLQELITAASKKEVLNAAPNMDFHEHRILASPVLCRRTLSIKSLTDSKSELSCSRSTNEDEEKGGKGADKEYDKIVAECEALSEDDLLPQATADPATCCNVVALIELSRRHGRDYRVDGDTITELMEHHYKTQDGDWLALRCCAAFLRKTVDSLAPSVSAVIASGRSLSFGVHGQPEILVEGPMHPRLLRGTLHDQVGEQSLLHSSLQQESLIYIAELLVDHPELFKGILIIRLGSLIEVLQSAQRQEQRPLEKLPPHLLSKKIRNLLSADQKPKEGQWKEHRLITGILGRVPDDFPSRVWLILQHQKIRFFCGEGSLVSTDILSTKVSEPYFAMKIERFLNCFPADTRHFVIELFHVLSATLQRNPEVSLVDEFPVLEFIEKSEVRLEQSFEEVSKKFIGCLIKFEFVRLANIENCIVS